MPMDIVQRLRELASYPKFSRAAGTSLMNEAASEIENLRHDIDRAIANHSADLNPK